MDGAGAHLWGLLLMGDCCLSFPVGGIKPGREKGLPMGFTGEGR